MKKAIVFGANGYIGRHIVKHLSSLNYLVNCYDLGQTSKDGIQNYFSLDLTNSEQVKVINFNVDVIYMFAGKTGTLNGFDDSASFLMANELSLLNVLNSIKNLSVKPMLVFPSTRLVYKGQKDIFLKEEDRKEAKTVYAANKIACEHLIEAYANCFDIPFIITRICVPYGNCFGGSYSYGTIGFFLNKALSKNNIILYGDGSQKRTFTHVEDIVRSIELLTQSNLVDNGVYNIGSKDNISLLEAASIIAEKYNVGIDFIAWPEKALKIESGDTIFCDSLLNSKITYNYGWSIERWVTSF